MIEWKLFELEFGSVFCRQVVIERYDVADTGNVRIDARDRYDDDLLQAVDVAGDLRHPQQTIDSLAIVEIAVAGDQHLGGYLAESVHDSGESEIR